jgi:hypothetical protein
MRRQRGGNSPLFQREDPALGCTRGDWRWMAMRRVSQIAKAAGKQRVTVRAALRAIGLYDDTESTRKGT